MSNLQQTLDFAISNSSHESLIQTEKEDFGHKRKIDGVVTIIKKAKGKFFEKGSDLQINVNLPIGNLLLIASGIRNENKGHNEKESRIKGQSF